MDRFFKSIEYIEAHLYDKTSVHEIATSAHYSTYHYSRVFKALVGDTPKEYLRKRRLTLAAKRLLTDDVGILDLAIECQFESQEAFTRAFKALFDMTPAQYRKINEPFRLLYKKPVSQEDLAFLQNNLSMEPEIIEQAAMKIVGIATQYDDGDLSLPKLWSGFRPYRDKIPNRVGSDFFGIYENYEESEEVTRFVYICSAQVENFDDVPEGLITRELAAQTYARFTHIGPIAKLEETLRYIWGSWLPKSKYEYADKPDFELLPANFNDADPNNKIYLNIPIKPKA
ncbi:AraC family transcriptional regulator [Pseudoalteromonas luteoviolacea]|uniref:AraC family transcriptional regulator n=1 Tax=Pseudoalteromonas luteoviolacea TaxID=43657 RepID=UPI001B39CD06|nr:AraC family transcriptional regulator [Pseudoalteromonas luteoviolacea]MBQ4875727.1 AraC family transcriptional regulator [Pseudoalteromonas luteoviolacea]MBQ4904762.1 AraC family transcriptional regulator [Pseudoalteromonas luteoviolacea]